MSGWEPNTIYEVQDRIRQNQALVNAPTGASHFDVEVAKAALKYLYQKEQEFLSQPGSLDQPVVGGQNYYNQQQQQFEQEQAARRQRINSGQQQSIAGGIVGLAQVIKQARNTPEAKAKRARKKAEKARKKAARKAERENKRMSRQSRRSRNVSDNKNLHNEIANQYDKMKAEQQAKIEAQRRAMDSQPKDDPYASFKEYRKRINQ